MKTVVVIGGGFAGLSAGVDLAAAGVRAIVLEGKPRLGGRAYSFTDQATGEVVDNGQHAMMGCYTHALRFLDRIGATPKLHRQANLRVDMIHVRLGAGTIACPALPGPLHMLSGILGYRLLQRRDRWRALLGGARLLAMHRRHDPALRSATVEQILCRLRQSPHTRDAFWNPVAVATLNESPARAAAAPFAEVLARAFFGSRADSQFVLSSVGLSDLYTDDARRFIEARGGCVRTKATVAGLDVSADRVCGVVLRDGERVAADACISTVPPRALAALLPPVLRECGSLRTLDAFETSPIVSTHLWVDRPVLAGDFVGFVGTTTQWVYNRSLLTPGSADHQGQYLSAVISAGREVVDWENDRIAGQVWTDIRALLPAAREARMVRAVVVKEKHATIAPTPEAERRRPGAVTAFPNFFLAGDWTDTGLPATIESAVLSGQRAAALAGVNGAATR
jgi:squalene-associated FAD-dependent desaturase